MKDSIGLREFYDKHKNNYMWGDRVEATVYTCANEEVAAEVRKLMKRSTMMILLWLVSTKVHS